MNSRAVVIGVAIVVLLGLPVALMDKPKGIRNNNPGNLRDTGTAWNGRIGQDASGFIKFSSPFYGLRAAARNLYNYRKRGVGTIAGIAQLWAPASDGNNVNEYAQGLSNETGINSDAFINLSDPTVLAGLVKGIVRNENGTNLGRPWYSDTLVMQAVRSALG